MSATVYFTQRKCVCLHTNNVQPFRAVHVGLTKNIFSTSPEIKTWKAKDLKQNLKDRGLFCSGRKDELIDQVCVAEGISRSGSKDKPISVELESKRVKILPTDLAGNTRLYPKI